MKIYVASSYQNHRQAKHWMDRLTAEGHIVTHDWTPHDPNNVEVPELDLSLEVQRALATRDLQGVAEADLLWVLSPAHGGCGCWVEMGYAIGLMKPVVVSGPSRRTIFTSMVSYQSTHEEAHGMLVDYLEVWLPPTIGKLT